MLSYLIFKARHELVAAIPIIKMEKLRVTKENYLSRSIHL